MTDASQDYAVAPCPHGRPTWRACPHCLGINKLPVEPAAIGCVFCEIIAGESPSTQLDHWPTAVAIAPLNPVTDGHALVIPKRHVRDATENLHVTSGVMACAAEYANQFKACNIITSVGAAATQTVFHLHVHVVPRVEGDGLHLPWTGQDE